MGLLEHQSLHESEEEESELELEDDEEELEESLRHWVVVTVTVAEGMVKTTEEVVVVTVLPISPE